MTEPTPDQLNCGHCLYGPPAICTCGTCDTKDYCQTCGGTGDSEVYALEGQCPFCNGTGKQSVTEIDGCMVHSDVPMSDASKDAIRGVIAAVKNKLS